MDLKIRQLAEKLYQVGVGKIMHTYQGDCPNLDGNDVSPWDKDCPACRVLIDYEQYKKNIKNN